MSALGSPYNPASSRAGPSKTAPGTPKKRKKKATTSSPKYLPGSPRSSVPGTPPKKKAKKAPARVNEVKVAVAAPKVSQKPRQSKQTASTGGSAGAGASDAASFQVIDGDGKVVAASNFSADLPTLREQMRAEFDCRFSETVLFAHVRAPAFEVPVVDSDDFEYFKQRAVKASERQVLRAKIVPKASLPTIVAMEPIPQAFAPAPTPTATTAAVPTAVKAPTVPLEPSKPSKATKRKREPSPPPPPPAAAAATPSTETPPPPPPAVESKRKSKKQKSDSKVQSVREGPPAPAALATSTETTAPVGAAKKLKKQKSDPKAQIAQEDAQKAPEVEKAPMAAPVAASVDTPVAAPVTALVAAAESSEPKNPAKSRKMKRNEQKLAQKAPGQTTADVPMTEGSPQSANQALAPYLQAVAETASSRGMSPAEAKFKANAEKKAAKKAEKTSKRKQARAASRDPAASGASTPVPATPAPAASDSEVGMSVARETTSTQPTSAYEGDRTIKKPATGRKQAQKAPKPKTAGQIELEKYRAEQARLAAEKAGGSEPEVAATPSVAEAASRKEAQPATEMTSFDSASPAPPVTETAPSKKRKSAAEKENSATSSATPADTEAPSKKLKSAPEKVHSIPPAVEAPSKKTAAKSTKAKAAPAVPPLVVRNALINAVEPPAPSESSESDSSDSQEESSSESDAAPNGAAAAPQPSLATLKPVEPIPQAALMATLPDSDAESYSDDDDEEESQERSNKRVKFQRLPSPGSDDGVTLAGPSGQLDEDESDESDAEDRRAPNGVPALVGESVVSARNASSVKPAEDDDDQTEPESSESDKSDSDAESESSVDEEPTPDQMTQDRALSPAVAEPTVDSPSSPAAVDEAISQPDREDVEMDAPESLTQPEEDVDMDAEPPIANGDTVNGKIEEQTNGHVSEQEEEQDQVPELNTQPPAPTPTTGPSPRKTRAERARSQQPVTEEVAEAPPVAPSTKRRPGRPRKADLTVAADAGKVNGPEVTVEAETAPPTATSQDSDVGRPVPRRHQCAPASSQAVAEPEAPIVAPASTQSPQTAPTELVPASQSPQLTLSNLSVPPLTRGLSSGSDDGTPTTTRTAKEVSPASGSLSEHAQEMRSRSMSRHRCLICDEIPGHYQKDCPIVISGLSALKRRLRHLEQEGKVDNTIQKIFTTWIARQEKDARDSARKRDLELAANPPPPPATQIPDSQPPAPSSEMNPPPDSITSKLNGIVTPKASSPAIPPPPAAEGSRAATLRRAAPSASQPPASPSPRPGARKQGSSAARVSLSQPDYSSNRIPTLSSLDAGALRSRQTPSLNRRSSLLALEPKKTDAPIGADMDDDDESTASEADSSSSEDEAAAAATSKSALSAIDSTRIAGGGASSSQRGKAPVPKSW